jgi:hypothetical protein
VRLLEHLGDIRDSSVEAKECHDCSAGMDIAKRIGGEEARIGWGSAGCVRGIVIRPRS